MMSTFEDKDIFVCPDFDADLYELINIGEVSDVVVTHDSLIHDVIMGSC
jgi:hypothetical protein